MLERLAVRDELQCERPHVLGEDVLVQKRLEIHGFGAAGDALPVEAGKRIGNKAVFGKGAGGAAGDRTGILVAGRDVHKGDAAGNGAPGAVERLCYAGAGDAADVGFAREGALGKAGADGRAGEAGDAADVGARGALRGAVVFTGRDEAEIHPAADTAGVGALGGDGAGVYAGLQDGAIGILPLIAAVEVGRDVVLGVERVFKGHRACDTAGIDVAGDGGFVAAEGDFAEGDLVDIDRGSVGDDVFDAIFGVVDGVEEGI